MTRQFEQKTDTGEIKKKTRKFVVSKFLLGADSKTVDDNDSFLEKGIIDSTGILELVNFLQETFSIRIEDEELIPDNLDSLEKIAVFIEHKLQKLKGRNG